MHFVRHVAVGVVLLLAAPWVVLARGHSSCHSHSHRHRHSHHLGGGHTTDFQSFSSMTSGSHHQESSKASEIAPAEKHELHCELGYVAVDGVYVPGPERL